MWGEAKMGGVKPFPVVFRCESFDVYDTSTERMPEDPTPFVVRSNRGDWVFRHIENAVAWGAMNGNPAIDGEVTTPKEPRDLNLFGHASNGIVHERRYRFFGVKPDDIISILGNWHHQDFIRLPHIKGLPEGYRIVGISYVECAFDDCVKLKIYHPSFDPVADFMRIPEIERAEFEFVDLRRIEKVEVANG